ncbi:MAG: hypothetical protein ACRECQ_03945 [Burkholderiaceae bacterium]
MNDTAVFAPGATVRGVAKSIVGTRLADGSVALGSVADAGAGEAASGAAVFAGAALVAGCGAGKS